MVAARGWKARKNGEWGLNGLFPLRVEVFGNQIMVMATEHGECTKCWNTYVKMAKDGLYIS